MSGYLDILKSNRLDKMGFVKSTKTAIPWKIVFQQEYADLITARKIEYKLKNINQEK